MRPTQTAPHDRPLKLNPRLQMDEPPGGRLDLDRVSPLQQAILERARARVSRGEWLPRMSKPQWLLSGAIAVGLVLGLFSVVNEGLRAFQLFMNAMSQPATTASAVPGGAATSEVESAPVDVTAPMSITVVPAEEAVPR